MTCAGYQQTADGEGSPDCARRVRAKSGKWSGWCARSAMAGLESLTSSQLFLPMALGHAISSKLRAVAQLGRALRSGRRGRGFKSHQPDHFSQTQPRCAAKARVKQWQWRPFALHGGESRPTLHRPPRGRGTPAHIPRHRRRSRSCAGRRRGRSSRHTRP